MMAKKIPEGDKATKKYHVFPNIKRIANSPRALSIQPEGTVLRDFSDPPMVIEKLVDGCWAMPGSNTRYLPAQLCKLSTDLGWIKLFPLVEPSTTNDEIRQLYACLEEQRAQHG